ncbi:MAG TPA: alpha/beta hydrolase fold domain-containing protein [Dehalococcoidia bacterium]|nr:alpha/beta hydrolase fold domain-containing protein [Dehalococcoidia bacterium]
MPSEALAQIVAMLRTQQMPADVDLVAMRNSPRRQVVPLDADVTVEQVEIGGVPAEWVSVPNSVDRAVLHFHGGGYCLGSPESHRQLGARLARAAAARVLLPDYRLAPEHPFPAAVDDAVAAYRSLLAQGVAPERLAVSGDSAGGGLAVALLLALREAGVRLPAAVALQSPWTDLTHSGDSIKTRAERDPMVPPSLLVKMADAYLAGAEATHPLASPLFGDLAGLPPMLIQVGTEEILFDDGARLADRARAAGVDVTFEPCEELFHVFQLMAQMLPEGQEAIERIGAFLQARLARATTATGD